MKSLVRRLVVAMLLAVAVYGAFVLYSGYERVKESLSGFHATAFLAAVGLSSANYLVRFIKWEYYLARLGVRGIPKLDSLLVFLSGFVLTVTPGKVGEVFKSAVLAETHGVPVAKTAPIVFAERITDVIGVVALILLGSLGFSGGLSWALAGAAAVGAGLALVAWQAPARAVVARFERGSPRLRALAPKLLEALDGLRKVAGPGALAIPSALSILGWGLEGVALSVLLEGFGTPVALAHCLFFYATATLAGALIPVPGGLGVVEAMIQEQLVRVAGVASGAATASMLLLRFATLWWAVLVGFGALFLLRLRHPTAAGKPIGAGSDVPNSRDDGQGGIG